jgi:GntR family transcriptional regulator
MHIVINPADELPLYRQIMRQITDAIAGGRLAAGDRLLSHRDLSERLVVAPLTVKKAYDELEALGYIESQRGRGTFVSAKQSKALRRAHAEQVADDARRLVSQAYLAGMSLHDVLALIKDADRHLAAGASRTLKKERAS